MTTTKDRGEAQPDGEDTYLVQMQNGELGGTVCVFVFEIGSLVTRRKEIDPQHPGLDDQRSGD